MAVILDFVEEEITEAELLDQLGWPRDQAEAQVIGLLEQALHGHDADAVEMGVILADHFGLVPAFSDIFTRLLREDWHIKHEDLAFALGKLKATQAVDALCEAAQTSHDYLAYDDSEALASKCIRALERIATPEALQRLHELAGHEREFIRTEAQEALDRHGE